MLRAKKLSGGVVAVAVAALFISGISNIAAASSTSIPAGTGAENEAVSRTANLAGAPPPRTPNTKERLAEKYGLQLAPKAKIGTKPKGANPFLSLPSKRSGLDVEGWRKYLEQKGKLRAKSRVSAAGDPQVVDEDEPAGGRGSNDSRAAAQQITGFGTAANPRARVLGRLSPERVPVDPGSASKEDDGSIPKARSTGVEKDSLGLKVSGKIGDGPYGSKGKKTGDFDVYRIDATAGRQIVVDVDSGTLTDSYILLFDAKGNFLAEGEYNDPVNYEQLLEYTPAKAGAYYALIGGYDSYPDDPMKSDSGTGVGAEGTYNVTIKSIEVDRDFYSVRLKAGDVLGAGVTDAARRVTIYDGRGSNLMGSEQDASFIMPTTTPLPGGGNALADYVVRSTGTYYIAVERGDGRYDLNLEVYRPKLEGTETGQIVFLDFDGARVNTAIWGGPGVRTLSPLRSFLARWGLTRADEAAVIKQAIATVNENLAEDMKARGTNPNTRITVKSSLDSPDTFGSPNVTRAIVGGTIDESGIDTIGIAQTIDPGNFGTEESVLVLLDELSGPKENYYSLNAYLKPTSKKVKFVGTALGNVISHELGHVLGDWHTDSLNRTVDIMDEGGDFEGMFGVGPDGIGGSADDIDADFVTDKYSLFEGFMGSEGTLDKTAWALT